eukprot:COSAG06_NODE_2894_length_6125_cov_53.442748_4_plen_114_part_00
MNRYLGAYLSARDCAQIFIKSIETDDIRDEHGVPFQVFCAFPPACQPAAQQYSNATYHRTMSVSADGISGNYNRFWSISNAKRVIGYEPEDNALVKFSERVAEIVAAVQTGKL